MFVHMNKIYFISTVYLLRGNGFVDLKTITWYTRCRNSRNTVAPFCFKPSRIERMSIKQIFICNLYIQKSTIYWHCYYGATLSEKLLILSKRTKFFNRNAFDINKQILYGEKNTFGVWSIYMSLYMANQNRRQNKKK